jgi:hypothetical protein
LDRRETRSLYALLELIECRKTVTQQRQAIGRGFRAQPVAVKQAHPDGAFQSAMALEMTGWEIARRSAARAMLFHCTTARRMCTSRNFSLRPIRSANPLSPHSQMAIV